VTITILKASSFSIPAGLAASCAELPVGAGWLARLPSLVRDVAERWSLTLSDPFDSGDVSCSWVARAVRAGGTPAVLKLGMPHMEGEDELLGLRFWNGDPTVQLIESDETLNAMLLERCDPGTTLRSSPEVEQDIVIAGLLQRLWRDPPPKSPFRPLAMMLAHWSDETRAAPEQWSDAGLVNEALQLFVDLPATAPRNVVLATDLHAGNVLRAQREPWLVIDPKPFVGDPAYDATQHLFNCRERMREDPLGTIRRVADLLGVDHERVRLWTFARAASEPKDVWGGQASAIARALAL
jgi:streptomycin 6-kinase